MRDDNPFDAHLKVIKISEEVREAAVFVTDTLNISWLAAKSVFEGSASPETALAIFDRIVSRLHEH